MQTDLAIGPAGDVWVMNNWQDIDSCFGIPPEAVSTRCGGQGVTIFFGMAKPVRAPQIGARFLVGGLISPCRHPRPGRSGPEQEGPPQIVIAPVVARQAARRLAGTIARLRRRPSCKCLELRSLNRSLKSRTDSPANVRHERAATSEWLR
jgi:hypothetical protein